MFFDLKQSPRLPLVGLFLLSIAACSATRPLETRPVATARDPKIVEEPIALSPSVNARVTKVQFFEGERSKLALADRKYETRFATKMARTIYTEISLDHPRTESHLSFPIRLDFRRNGRTVRIEEVDNRIGPDWGYWQL